jgi:hypothetical protein
MDTEDVAVTGIGCMGCLIWIVYLFFSLAFWTFAGWTILAWIGIVNNYPWQ